MPSHPIDWDHLLHRPTPPSLEAVALKHGSAIRGRRILVTGAAGSIGSALARTVALAGAAELILLDIAEAEVCALAHTLRAAAVTASVTDSKALAESIHRYRPEIVFHAAAFKHVPLGETAPFAVVEANAVGTANLAAAAANHGVEQLVVVSTDKAADPLSLMGASKRIAEQLLLAEPKKICATAVRLGNVLGSSASVVPLFLEQISSGGPITVTHPQARRYFMTTEEAVAALLAAVSCSSGLFAADPGSPVSILRLAQYLITRSNNPETKIAFTALRPGDKLEESLLSTSESFAQEANTPLRKIRSSIPNLAAIEAAMHQVKKSIFRHHLPQLIEAVQSIVPAYQPSHLLREQIRAQAVEA